MIYELSIIPIIAALAIIATLGRSNRAIKYIALLGSLTPLLFLPDMLQSIGSITSMSWFSLGTYSFPITISLLPINILLFGLVSVIGPLIIIYSWGYMDKQSEDKSFYIEMLAFEASMLAFAISGNFILLFMAWEFLSLTSYLLIGFYGKPASIRGARKAVTVILIGDIALLAGIVLLWHSFSTFQFSSIISSLQGHALNLEAELGVFLVLVAVLTKSAQFPFSQWLPDAMEGPTPVSAFLHSSTMVKAGVFLTLVLFGLFSAAGMLPLILIIGIASALLAVSNAFYETQIKRVLAYSTIEELSLMLVAVGLGAFGVALYIFIVQTFYKALLFLYSGILIKANSTENIYEMRNARSNKALLAAGIVGVLSLAGFIPFSGFFSNVSLESTAMSSSLLIYAVLLAIDFLVSMMIARWFSVPLEQEKNKKISGKLEMNYSLVSKPMYIAFYILAILTLLSALAILYTQNIAIGMSAFGYSVNSSIPITSIEIGVAILTVGIGFWIGYRLFYKKTHDSANPLYSLLSNNSLMNKIYSYASSFAYDLSVLLSNFDILLSDIFDGLGENTSYTSQAVRRIQSGQVNFYAAVFIVGVLLLLGYLIFWVS